ncbi:hypothetical protein [Vibrio parahaemolyticus]|uniref:hypothetical protein n=2 Tax=Gammaproteobacteria TaxID=1236 RepID=UPI00227C5A36|nr:hypothetical protein [Vibrio parahaemolyticus]WAG36382.1 hypothetical protein JK088_24555 [Vibrio parahaemolyticus]
MKPLQVMAGYFITGAASAGVACLFVLAVVLFCQALVTGSAADWVSSVANIVMAITAVLAFITARSWLPQLMTQEGYKEAIRLVNDQYIQLSPVNPLEHHTDKAINAFRQLNEKGFAALDRTYDDILQEMSSQVNVYTAVKQEIRDTHFRLNTYGLVVAKKYAFDLKQMTEAFELAHDSALKLMSFLAGDLLLRKEANAPTEHYNKVNTAILILSMHQQKRADHVEELYRGFAAHHRKMTDSYNAVFSHHPSVGKLYTVKR